MKPVPYFNKKLFYLICGLSTLVYFLKWNFQSTYPTPLYGAKKSYVSAALSRSYDVTRATIRHTPCEEFGEPPNWSKKFKPLLKMDETKYLYPQILEGLGNQLIGLQLGIQMAVRLNRTLVLPAFMVHNNTKSIPTSQVIDVTKLRKSISVISVSELKQSCRGKFDAVFLLSHIWPFYLKTAEHYTEMKLIRNYTARLDEDHRLFPADLAAFGINAYPKNFKPKSRVLITPRSEIKQRFATDDKCVVLLTNIFGFPRMDDFPRDHGAVGYNMSDEQLYSLSYKLSRRPPMVDKMAKEFVSKTLGGNFVSLHFRYDEGDWMTDHRCKYPAKTKTCEMVRKKNASLTMATKMSHFLKVKHHGINKVYIAHPPTNAHFITQFKAYFKRKRPKIEFFNSSDLVRALKSKFHDCFHKVDFGTAMSMLDMEVCTKSDLFIYSVASTWSDRVRTARNNKNSISVNRFLQ
nr:uncharacterized protein LOC100183376 [Ciona intestinalis]|eukprot:XP_002119809.1 uncharacterized protein LOC100183376 [Ciona intestinalis]